MKPPSAVAAAAARLRTKAWAAADGDPLGGENDLQAELGVTRSTLRQAARLLETEGLLTVRRGTNGGYFASRPDVDVIEAAVSAYLRANSIALGDLVTVASLLWSEVVRLAAVSADPDFSAKVRRLEAVIEATDPAMTHAHFVAAEQALSEGIFDLAGSRYIALIFRINRGFAAQEGSAGPLGDPAMYAMWRQAKRLEIAAIRDRDAALAVFAAHRSRRFFDQWIRAAEGRPA